MIEAFKLGPNHLRRKFILNIEVVCSSTQVLVDGDHTKMPMKSFSLDLLVRTRDVEPSASPSQSISIVVELIRAL